MGKRPPNNDIEKAGYYHHQSTPALPPHVPRPWFVWLVPLIFLANVIVFIYTMYVNNCPAHIDQDKCLLSDLLKRFSFQPLKENHVLGPSITTLQDLGALDHNKIVNEGEAYRLFSCNWLHAGLVHLLTNMMSLLFIGLKLEEEFGFFKIGLLYLLAGLGGSLMSSLSPKPLISVGASGALLGLLGSMLSELIVNWTIYANKCAAITSLIIVIGINLAIGFIPQVDSLAHFGGFTSGFLLGFVLLIRPQYGYVSRKYIPAGYEVKHKKSRYKCYQYLLCIISTIVLIAGYAWAFDMLYTGEKLEHFSLDAIN